MKSWRFTQAGPPRTVLGWLRGAQPSPDPQEGPALRSLRLLRKPRRAWGGNINQSSEQCPIVGSPGGARPGQDRHGQDGPGPARGCGVAASPSPAPRGSVDCPPSALPGTPRHWRQPWPRAPLVLTLPAPGSAARQPFLLLIRGGKGNPKLPRRPGPALRGQRWVPRRAGVVATGQV